MRIIDVIEKDDKFILKNQYNEEKIFNDVRSLVNELMHYRGDSYTRDRAIQLLRFYGTKIKE